MSSERPPSSQTFSEVGGGTANACPALGPSPAEAQQPSRDHGVGPQTRPERNQGEGRPLLPRSAIYSYVQAGHLLPRNPLFPFTPPIIMTVQHWPMTQSKMEHRQVGDKVKYEDCISTWVEGGSKLRSHSEDVRGTWEAQELTHLC